MLTDSGEAEQPETRISTQAGQPQCPPGPAFLSQAQVAIAASGTCGGKTQQKDDASAK